MERRRALTGYRAAAVAALILAAAVGAGMGCSKQDSPDARASVRFQVNVQGWIVGADTTYAPTGKSVNIDPKSLYLVGESPNKRKFYGKRDEAPPHPDLYLHTGVDFYDVWARKQ
jgi:hypothetical protein